MEAVDDVALAKRQRLITALVALVDHVGGLGTRHSFEADQLAMELVEAVEMTHEELSLAQAELEVRRMSKAIGTRKQLPDASCPTSVH